MNDRGYPIRTHSIHPSIHPILPFYPFPSPTTPKISNYPILPISSFPFERISLPPFLPPRHPSKNKSSRYLHYTFLASNNPKLSAVSFSPTTGVGSLSASHRRK